MFCDKCGSKIPDGCLFCTSCGARLGKSGQKASDKMDKAKDELDRANSDAADVINAANAEAAQIAKDFSNSVESAQNTINVNNEQHYRQTAGDAGTGFGYNDVYGSQSTEPGTLHIESPDNNTAESGESRKDTMLPDTVDASGNALQETEDGFSSVPKSGSGTELVTTNGQQLPDSEENQMTGSDDQTFTEQSSRDIFESEERDRSRRSSGDIKPGKSIPAGLIIAASAGLVILIIACVFIFSGSARDGLKRMFMSDENYFRSVEKNAVSEIIDSIGEAYEDNIVGFFDFMKSEYVLSLDVDVKDEAEDFLESIYKKNRDLDLSWIKSASAEAEFKMRDKMLQINGEAGINKKDLFSFDLIGNMNEDKLYLGIPILSKEYAKFDISNSGDGNSIAGDNSESNLLDKMIESDAFQKALPTKKEISRIVDRYLDIALSKIKKIRYYEDQKLEAAGVKERYTMITAELDDTVQGDIFSAVLKELSKDDEVLAIVNRIEKTGVFGDKVSADAFLDWIEKKEDVVFDEEYPFRTLNIWLDDTGKVVGQQIVTDDGTGWTYKYVINGNNFGFEAYEARKSRAVWNILASGTISGSTVTGNVKYYNNGSEKLSLNFIDIDVLDVMRGNPTGSLVLDVYDMLGDRQYRDMKVTVEFDLSLKKSSVKAMLSDAGKTIIEADILLKKSSSGKIKEPSKVLDIDNNNSIFTWVKNFDWGTVLKNADKSNMPSRYYRQLEKWSESDLGNEIDEISDLIRKYSIRNFSENDLYNLIN